MRIHRFLLATIILSGTHALAQAKDWKLTQETHPLLQKEVCKASTLIQGPGLSLEYSLSFAKDKTSAPVILMTARGQQVTGTEVQILWGGADKKKMDRFRLLLNAQDANGASAFWQSPKEITRTLQNIRDLSKVTVQLVVPGKRTVVGSLSLRGSSATLDDTLKCLNDKVFIRAGFLDLLKKSTQGLSPDTTMTELELYQKVQELNFQQLNAARLQALSAQSKEALRQLQLTESFRANDLATKKQGLANDDQRTLALQNRIPQIPADISRAEVVSSDLERQLPSVTAEFNQERAIYEPMQQQLSWFDSQITGARNTLDLVEQRLRSLDSSLNQLPNQIAQLRSRLEQGRRELSNLESTVWQAQNEYNQAEANRQRFDRDGEIRSRLHNNFDFRRAFEEMRRAEHELNRVRPQYEEMRRGWDPLREPLKACLRWQPDCRAQLTDLHRSQVELSACQGRADGGMRPNRPTPPTPPTPSGDCSALQATVDQKLQVYQQCLNQPRPDCSHENNRVLEYERRMNELGRRVMVLESEVSNAQRQVESIRSNIEREVNSLANSLDQAVSQASTRLNQIQARIGQLQSEQNNLRADISDLQQRLDSLENQRPGLLNQRRDAQLQLSQAQSEKARFESQNDVESARRSYDQARAEYNRVSQAASEASRRLSDLRSEQVRSEEELKNLQARRPAAEQAILAAGEALESTRQQVASAKAAAESQEADAIAANALFEQTHVQVLRGQMARP